MTVSAVDKIVAWLNMSKSTLKAGQSEQLTIEFSQDPGALSISDFKAVGGVLSDLEGSGMERTVTFTAGANAGPASVSIQSNAFQVIPSAPLAVFAAPHTIGISQFDQSLTPAAQQPFNPTVVHGAYNALPTLTGHADAGSTLKVLLQSAGNLIAAPNDMSKLASSYIKVTADVAADPLGGKTADLLTSTLSSGGTFVETYQNANIVQGQAYTLSAYVKAAGTNFAQVVGNYGTFGGFNVNFDLSKGVVSQTNQSTGAVLGSGIDAAGDGWYRVWVTAQAIGSNGSNHLSLGMVKSATSIRGDGALAANSGLQVWDFSFEQTNSPPPVIASVTTDANGVWTYTPASTLQQGSYKVSATETAGQALGVKAIDGLTMDANGSATITIDTHADAPVFTIAGGAKTAPVVSGAAEKLAVVDVVFMAADGETHDYKAQAATDGAWKVDTSSAPLTGGKTWTVVAHQTDAAGNVSANSAAQTIVSPLTAQQDVLSGNANANSTIKLVFAHDANVIVSTNDMSALSASSIQTTVNVATDPLGGNTADLLKSTLASGRGFVETYQNANIVAGKAYTLSAYVKAAGGDFAQVVGNYGTFGGFNVNFDLSHGVVSQVNQSTGHILGSGIDSVGDGWYRIWVSAEAVGSASSNHMSLGMVKSATSDRGDGALAANSGLQVWDFTFEQSNGPAPVIASVQTDANGAWSYNAGALIDGKYAVSTFAADGSADKTLHFAVAQGVVSAPAAAETYHIPTVKDGDAYHVDSTGSWTNKHDVSLEGLGAAGSTITIFEANSPMKGADGHGDRTVLGTATVGQDGHWTFNAKGLSEGEHTIYTELTSVTGQTDTSIEKILFPGYEVQAHRSWGVPSVWSQAKPEETIVAAENVVASNLGVSYFDGDTRSTKDGVLVLLHDGGDNPWARTTGNQILGATENYTYAQTYQFSVGANIGQQAKVATFEELVVYAKSVGMEISMEVRSADQCIAAMAILERYGMVQHTILNSFNPGDIEPALQIDPEARLCLITFGASPGQIGKVKSWGPNASILSCVTDTTAGVVKACNDAGVAIGVWTPATTDQFNQMHDLGITTFCTDGPVTGAVEQPVLHLMVDTQVDAPTFTIAHDATKAGTYDLQGKAEAFARIDIFGANGQFLKTVQAEGGGVWTAELPLDAGTTYLQARQTDQAGNESCLSKGVLTQSHLQLSSDMVSSKVLAAPSSAYAGVTGAVAIGDFNHDGVQDYVIKSGDTAIVKSGVGGAVLATLASDGNGGTVGASFAGLGDTNGDGYSDVIIGSSDASGFNVAYVLFGSSSKEGTMSTTVIDGGGSDHGYAIRAEESGVKAGWVVASAGDVNGDGLNYMIVTAQNGGAGAGETYVVFGKTDTDMVYLRDVALGQGGFVIDGVAGSHAGTTAFGAGDLNGDGFADLVVGDSAGHQYVVYGGAKFVTQALINGTTGDDALTGTSSAETIVGGKGNDVIDGKGGADVLLGGDGNDTFVFGAAMAHDNAFVRMDGGAGVDKIELHDGVSFDLTKLLSLAPNQAIGGNHVANIETIDMATDATHNEVTFSAASVFAVGGQMTGGGVTFAHGLIIDGASNDTLHLTSVDGWRVDATVHSSDYDFYVASNGAHLMVNHQVHLDLH